MRLIDADELIEHLRKDPLFELVERYGIVDVIDSRPTVDAVPVVRCKDCKWGSFHTHIPPWTHYCVRDPKEAPSKQAMDFCSYGERKDDETD